MLHYIKGIITELAESYAIIESNGIGYECGVSNQTLANLRVGDSAKLFTYMAVREDDVSLYGFLEKHEKSLFLKLLSISGVGAKVALSILSGLSATNLISAVACGDVASLCGIKGIGKKTAERLILELKDKIGDEFAILPASHGESSLIIRDTLHAVAHDAIAALVSLGYSKTEAAQAVAKVGDVESLSVEEIILKALKG